MNDSNRMKPIIIVKTGCLKEKDIAELKSNGLCVVVAQNPEQVKFLDPIPSVLDRTRCEQAAISLSRRLMTQGFWTNEETRRMVATTFVEILVKGTSLDPQPSKEETEKEIFDQAKADELRRLAREEAKQERIKLKQSSQQKTS